MNKKWKTVLARIIRVTIAGAAGALITVLPTVGDVFPTGAKQWVAIAVAAAIVGLDKLRRWGQDPGEM